MSDVKIEQVKSIEKIGHHIDIIEKADKKNRKFHGINPRLQKLKDECNRLKDLLTSEGCEFFEVSKRWCPILNEECDVINKSICSVRIKENEKQDKVEENLRILKK